MRRTATVAAFTVLFAAAPSDDAASQNPPPLYGFQSSCYSLSGTMADGSQTRLRSAASNMFPLGTRIRLTGPRHFYGGLRRFVVRDTGGPLMNSRIDLWWPNYFDCIRWGVRPVVFKLGWGRARARTAVSDRRAKQIAIDWSAKWCPHHFGGVCLRRRAFASRYWVGARPLGHNLIIEGWESLIIDPTRDWRRARWYYQRCGYLTSDGSRITNARWC